MSGIRNVRNEESRQDVKNEKLGMWKDSYEWKEISNEERPQNVRTEEYTRKG